MHKRAGSIGSCRYLSVVSRSTGPSSDVELASGANIPAADAAICGVTTSPYCWMANTYAVWYCCFMYVTNTSCHTNVERVINVLKPQSLSTELRMFSRETLNSTSYHSLGRHCCGESEALSYQNQRYEVIPETWQNVSASDKLWADSCKGFVRWMHPARLFLTVRRQSL